MTRRLEPFRLAREPQGNDAAAAMPGPCDGNMAFDRRLDLVNFLLADVRGGLGPYVGVFLIGHGQWDQATIGLVLTISGLLGISLHAPDRRPDRRDPAQARHSWSAGWQHWPPARVAIVQAPTCRWCWRRTSSWRCWAPCSRRPWPRSRWAWSRGRRPAPPRPQRRLRPGRQHRRRRRRRARRLGGVARGRVLPGPAVGAPDRRRRAVDPRRRDRP